MAIESKLRRATAYLKYLLESTNRHGLHSPFAYTLLDSGINRHKGISLLKRLQHYFGPQNVVVADNYNEWASTGGTRYMNDKKILYLPGIHNNEKAETAWKTVCADPKARVSIDLWEGGLLVFSDDFKQKQHFVIRWKK